MQKPTTGLFVISLDFELLWGVRDKRTIESYGQNLRGVREVIPRLLALFSKYGIHGTFATVGLLFSRNKQDLFDHIPEILPSYSMPEYSPYEGGYLSHIGESEEVDPYHYASSLIHLIRRHPDQEISTHTFSHYYCLEGASLESFKADIMAAQRIAISHEAAFKTIVFPRNQFSTEHIAICKNLGLIAFRGNEKATIYHPRKNNEHNKIIRALRMLDSYINITGHNTYFLNLHDEIINIPSSRFLRPYSKKLSFFDPLRLNRIKKSLTYAAKNKQVYHLWWHPHNFGVNINENFKFLESVLQHYKYLNETFGFSSKSMREIAEEIKVKNAK